MKIIPDFDIRCLVLGATFFAGVGFGSNALADLLYLVDLKQQDSNSFGRFGGIHSGAIGINDNGQAAGYSTNADGAIHAFITGANGANTRDLWHFGWYFQLWERY